MELIIDSVIADDSNPKERKFTIHYHLTNLTDKKLSFFQKPETLISSNGGSMSNCPYYKIYEGDTFLNLGSAFNRPEKGDPYPERVRYDYPDAERNEESIRLLKEHFIVTDSMVAEVRRTGRVTEKRELSDSLLNEIKAGRYEPKSTLQFRERVLMEERITLDPGEKKAFKKSVYWDKDRYFFHDPEEFYLSETAKHYIEITMLLMKEPFKDQLSDEDYAAIMADENFIKGVFVSNRAEINFN